jgi:hypothetical protein
VYLRAGTFYLPETLQLGVQDNDLTITAYNNEQVCVVLSCKQLQWLEAAVIACLWRFPLRVKRRK